MIEKRYEERTSFLMMRAAVRLIRLISIQSRIILCSGRNCYFLIGNKYLVIVVGGFVTNTGSSLHGGQWPRHRVK